MTRGRFAAAVAVAVLGLAATLSFTSPAHAAHDTPCKALPTSGTGTKSESCNPRHECLSKIPGNVQGAARTAAVATCNAAPTSGQCTRTVNTNPRQECIDKLPAPPAVTITSVEGTQGGNKITANKDEVLVVRGANVGQPGVTVRKYDEQVWSLSATPRQGCNPPDCLALGVKTGNIGGSWRFTIAAAHGHSEASGTFQSVLPPASATTAQPSPMAKKIDAVVGKPDLYFKSVSHDLWGEKIRVQISNKGRTLSPPLNVEMTLYRLDDKGRRESLTSATKAVFPLCPVSEGTSSAPCAAWWDGEFHIPITSFAKEVLLTIDPGGSVGDADSGNNTHRVSIPGTQR